MSESGWIDEPFYSKIKKMMPLPCVDLLVLHEGCLLLMKRNYPPEKGRWFTPGGRIYKGESIENAVRRVLEEETGLEPLSIKKVGVMSHVWPEVHSITVFHTVYVSSNKPRLNDEHDDYKWIRSIGDDTHPYIVQMVKEANILDK
jgi:colanic acid biosynthesis protein WcaH